jgi:hypothetical protein
MTTEGRPRSISLPAHVGVLIGVSAGAYALSLAAVTGLQAGSERAIRAEREPVAAAIERLATQGGQLNARLEEARAAYEAAAARYAATGLGFQDVAARLADLTAAVSEVSDTAASLPTGVNRPTVRTYTTTNRLPATATKPAPVTAANPAPVFAPAPAIAPALAPVTNATTSASGKP